MSYFSNLYGEVKYPIASGGSIGLRNAQLGAIHSIAAHSTLEPIDASVIVMPTGSGKTTVLMLAPYILQKEKSSHCYTQCYGPWTNSRRI